MEHFLNSKGTADDVDEKLKAFLNYLNGVVSDDEYIRFVQKPRRFFS